MTMLVTVQEVVNALKLPYNDDDPMEYQDLELKIKSASQSIIRYLGDRVTDVIEYDSDDEIIDVDPDVKMATLLYVGFLYNNREGGGNITPGYLPPAVMNQLYSMRDPVIA